MVSRPDGVDDSIWQAANARAVNMDLMRSDVRAISQLDNNDRISALRKVAAGPAPNACPACARSHSRTAVAAVRTEMCRHPGTPAAPPRGSGARATRCARWARPDPPAAGHEENRSDCLGGIASPWADIGEVVGPAVAAGPGGLIDDNLAQPGPCTRECGVIRRCEHVRVVPGTRCLVPLLRCASLGGGANPATLTTPRTRSGSRGTTSRRPAVLIALHRSVRLLIPPFDQPLKR